MNLEQYFLDYQRSFQLLLRWRTLWHLIVDLFLVLFFFLVGLVASFAAARILAPFAAAVDINALEQGAISAAELIASLAAAGVSPTAILHRLLIAYACAIIAYTSVYALLKILVWESVTATRLQWKPRLKIILWSVAGWLFLLLLIYLALKLAVFAGALMMLLALFTVLFVQPYLYARFLRGPPRQPSRYWVMVAIILITFIAVGNILSFIARYSLLAVVAAPLLLLLFLAWGRTYLAAVLEVQP